MNRTRWRLLVACLAVIGAAIAVAGGSAGNREGLVTFEALPGPGAVSYGENIAYRSTFDNTDTTARSSRRSDSCRRGRKRTIGTTTIMAANRRRRLARRRRGRSTRRTTPILRTTSSSATFSSSCGRRTNPRRSSLSGASRRTSPPPGGCRVLPQVRGQVADQGAEVDQRERDVPASPGRGLGAAARGRRIRTRHSGRAATSWGRAVAAARASARTRPSVSGTRSRRRSVCRRSRRAG